jgi:protein-disulfide isomerase
MTSSSPEPILTEPLDAADHVTGAADAAVMLIEYGDYECPTCLKAFPIIKQLLKQMPDVLQVAFRHFPQNSIHPHASVAAQAAEAAGAQGKFWKMHDALFTYQDRMDEWDMSQYAIKAELELYKFEADLSSERFARRVARDLESGRRGGVHKTPTLFINGIYYAGTLELAALAEAIQRALKGGTTDEHR